MIPTVTWPGSSRNPPAIRPSTPRSCRRGEKNSWPRIETRLGDKFHGIYETIDVPYTIYEIFANKKKIGYIHGVNQKGQFGGIQVFLVLDLEGRIKGFYIQKMTSQYAGKLRDAKFGKQFVGLTLKDFEHYDVVSGKASGKVEAIKNPAPEAEADFRAALRATKKNLILMDEFGLSSTQSQEVLKNDYEISSSI